MKTIELKRIELLNFKGIKSLEMNFKHNTDVYGRNEAGKTTIFDAWTWVLFGKDSQDRKDFEVKTLDENNKVIEKLNHEVTATLLVDGVEYVLRKILIEKWTKKKGSPQSEFTGNTIEHYFNGVPLGTAKEYQDKVNLICDETVFKLITNPAAFMALKWQDRRGELVKIADHKTNEQLANGNRDFEKLLSKLSNNKTLEEYSKEIFASIKKAKEDLKAIPTRIDEVVRGKCENLDFDQIEILLEVKKTELDEIDKGIQNKAGMFDVEINKNRDIKTKVNLLKNTVEIEESLLRKEARRQVNEQGESLTVVRSKIDANNEDIKTAENGIDTLTKKAALLGNEILETTAQIEKQREKWYAENAKELTFDNECFDCPTCKRAFEAGEIEAKKAKMQTDFIENKKTILAAITQTASSLKEISEKQQIEIDALNTRIENGNKHVKTLKENGEILEKELSDLLANTVLLFENDIFNDLLAKDENIKSKKSEIVELEAGLIDIPEIDFSEFTSKKKLLVEDIEDLQKKLQTREQIKLSDNRIKKLQAEEQILSQQILDVERTQFIIDNFNKVKIESIENSINSKLKTVKFKMFDKQINGGEVECCEAILDGVPYSNVNTAGKLNAGLDIINMLCEYYQVYAPIIIDNRESVTDIIKCESQIINLLVSPEDITLRTEAKTEKAILN